MKEIILASTSPRRVELLKKIEKSFKVIKPNFDEGKITTSDPYIFAMAAAYNKANSIFKDNTESLVIGSDTLISLEGKILGKPKSRDDARKMLGMLSDKNHCVISGISILSNEYKVVNYVVSEIKFKALSVGEIESYLDTEEYIGKAGSYAIQGYGSKLVEYYKGELDNIIGLPTKYLERHLNYVFSGGKDEP